MLLGAAAVLSACKQEQETVAGILEPDVEKIASQAEYRNKTLGNRTFALNLFRQAVAESQGENVLVSPFSANMALGCRWMMRRSQTHCVHDGSRRLLAGFYGTIG